jgi:hypothetical protein
MTNLLGLTTWYVEKANVWVTKYYTSLRLFALLCSWVIVLAKLLWFTLRHTSSTSVSHSDDAARFQYLAPVHPENATLSHVVTENINLRAERSKMPKCIRGWARNRQLRFLLLFFYLADQAPTMDDNQTRSSNTRYKVKKKAEEKSYSLSRHL